MKQAASALPYDKLRYISSAPSTPVAGIDHLRQQAPPSRSRCFFTVLCSILAAAAMVALGIALAVRAREHRSPTLPTPAADSTASYLSAACNATMYPDLCYQWLRGAASSSADDPVALASAAVRLALNFVKNATADLSAATANGTASDAVSDCLELMDLASDQLNASLDGLHSIPLLRLKSAIADILVQLSGTMAFDLACAQSLAEANATNLVSQENVSRSVIIALGIVTRLGVDLSAWQHRRRLLSSFHPLRSPSAAGVDFDGFPEWLSESDRRMLQSSTAISADIVVAADGSGNYKTIRDALAAVPSKRTNRFTIYVKQGVYAENLVIPKSMKNLTIIGDGVGLTVITGSRNNVDGSTTYDSATVAVSGPGFIARRLTFRNTAGASGHQAVALRANSDYAVFDTCGFEGYQDTLYALANRQFYTGCTISGTVDFIFGNAIAVFQHCNIVVRRPLDNQKNTITAHGRKTANDPSGFSFQLCTVDAGSDLSTSSGIPTFFGRPWHAYARTVWMQCTISDVIDPAGWLPWDPSNSFAATVYYGEYQNTGTGARTSARVAWPGVHPSMSQPEAAGFTVEQFIQGPSWLPDAQVTFQAALT